MALVFCAIVPHSPLLIPTIAKGKASSLAQSIMAMQVIAKRLAASRAETIIVLINHALDQANAVEAISFNINSHYQANFEEFGDYGMSYNVSGDLAIGQRLKHRFDTMREYRPIMVTSKDKLDGNISSSLFYIIKNRPSIKLVPIHDTINSERPEFSIGTKLRRPIYQDKSRVALIASINLSHRLNELSPAGYSARAKKFDKRVLAAVIKKTPTVLNRIKPETLTDVQECALRPLQLMMGVLQDTFYTPEILSYECPLGIGHAVIHLNF